MQKRVLWGYHVDEYMHMFDLTEDALNASFLEYASGPSAFNAELHAKGKTIVSCDPLFALDEEKLKHKTTDMFRNTIDMLKRNSKDFDFSLYGGLDAFKKKHQAGLQRFFEDYPCGVKEKRYLACTAVPLPFADFSFDFALSAHAFFNDAKQESIPLALHMIEELCRVAREVRIFPLIDRFNKPSPLLGPILLGLQEANFGLEVKEVPYHLQASDNAMLRVWSQQCQLKK